MIEVLAILVVGIGPLFGYALGYTLGYRDGDTEGSQREHELCKKVRT